MPYPVRFVGGPDTLEVGGRTYEQGAVIRTLPDQQRLSLQAAGVRFAAVHDDDPPPDPVTADVVALPPDQVAVNDEIEQAQRAPKVAKKDGD